MNLPGGIPSAHTDTFARTLLPARKYWPEFDYSADHLSHYPDQINAVEVLLDNAIREGAGDKPAYIHQGETWTYSMLKEQAERIARVLVEDYGLEPGNRVLLRSANNPMVIACWLGVLKAGGICVSTMPLLRAKELSYIVERVKIRLALCEYSLDSEMEKAKDLSPCLERVSYFSPLGQNNDEKADLDRRTAEKQPSFENVKTAADDVALIVFTSGSTGQPKAAAQFHRDILAVSDSVPLTYRIQADDVICGSPTFAFTYGLAAFILYPLRYRACAVLTPPKPELILQAIAQHRVTNLLAVPTSFNAMLNIIDNYDTSSLRQCSSAGEHLQLPLWEKWLEKTGVRIINGVGATEFMSHFLSDDVAVNRPGTAGRAVPGFKVKIIDQLGNEVPRGTSGLIAIKGTTGCRYLDDEDRQRGFVRDGWNVPSDLFMQDEDGYFWYLDRADDIIVSSGYNISPLEVERCILEHPLVAECAVVGVPDSERGKLVRACVVLKNPALEGAQTAKSIQDFVKENIAPYKYPRDIVFFDELPRTPTGKIQRFRLLE
ncbi:AMP-binding protein [Sedimenticola selenatireducens]|uniref:2-aminobenzoate-CoA ligase n=1 Tax=Sedimenticola selenatireducens TaxID=191960 RepID=A0A2N6CTU4_9GAMM|nr:AMP-binding protein [Sedimenticola selenatireducens]PLX60591.1 MAG: 2-aminobenzoate-CoA ligase [Sedimenticola selenatireducens]